MFLYFLNVAMILFNCVMMCVKFGQMVSVNTKIFNSIFVLNDYEYCCVRICCWDRELFNFFPPSFWKGVCSIIVIIERESAVRVTSENIFSLFSWLFLVEVLLFCNLWNWVSGIGYHIDKLAADMNCWVFLRKLEYNYLVWYY